MRRLALALAILASSACADERGDRLPPIDRGPGPRDPLGQALHRVVIARAGRLEEVDHERRGRLGGGQTEEALILGGGYCYALLVQAEPSAGELRIRLLDDRSEPLHVDRERGSSATLGLDEQLCAESPTQVRLEIDGEHAGAYALRVFRATAI